MLHSSFFIMLCCVLFVCPLFSFFLFYLIDMFWMFMLHVCFLIHFGETFVHVQVQSLFVCLLLFT
jgi:hypothetical protein